VIKQVDLKGPPDRLISTPENRTKAGMRKVVSIMSQGWLQYKKKRHCFGTKDAGSHTVLTKSKKTGKA